MIDDDELDERTAYFPLPHQSVETAKAAAAFRAYCVLPSRSLAKLAHTWTLPNGKPVANLRQLELWSSQYGWVDRAKQYDTMTATQRERKRQDAIEAMNEQHAKIASDLFTKVTQLIEDTLLELKPRDLVALLKVVTDLERIARSAPITNPNAVAVDELLPGLTIIIPHLPESERARYIHQGPPISNGDRLK